MHTKAITTTGGAFTLTANGQTPAAALVESFLAGRNASTLAAYRADLEAFARFAGGGSVEAAAARLIRSDAGNANVVALAYRAQLVGEGLAPATINRRLAALRSLVKLARVLGLVSWHLEVENMKARAYRDTAGPGRAGVRRMLAEVEADTTAKGLRDVAIIRLLHDCALRRGEVVGLDVQHVDLEGGRLWIMGKGRHDREAVTMPAPTAAAVRAWVEAHPTGTGPLFVNFDRAGKGDRLTGRSVARLVARVGDAAGLKVRPHGLRHSAITAALDATKGDVRKVQRFSRHMDVRVLSRYDDSRADFGGEVARLVAIG
jgi:integrase/recombinase XerC